MRQNPKYILASLPRCHELPIFINFVQMKYGIIYTRSYQKDRNKQSDVIYEQFIKDPLYVQPLDPRRLFKDKYLTYDKRNYIQRIVNKHTEEFHQKIRKLFINYARTYWGFMDPYMSSSATLPYTFFAYMPAMDRDMFLFGPTRLNQE